MLLGLRHRGMTWSTHRIAPCGIADVTQLAGEIAVVVLGDVGLEASEPEALEQMRLAQIADVVIDAAAFVPARDRQNIADENAKEEDADDDLCKLHEVV